MIRKNWKLDKNGKLPERTQEISLGIYLAVVASLFWVYALRDAGKCGGIVSFVVAIIVTFAAILLLWKAISK